MEGLASRIQDPELASLIEKRTKAAVALLIFDIDAELDRQTDKWGVQDHTLAAWMVILGEEYGEACHALLFSDWKNAVTEMVQIMAVLGRMVEKVHRLRDAKT